MAFYVAVAMSDGSRSTEFVTLSPGPVSVDYPTDPAGALLETDSTVVQQQPTYDNRRRSWIWDAFPATQPGYVRIWGVLESLRSRFRKEMGTSPYVWLKEDSTGLLRRRVSLSVNGSVTSGGLTFTATSGTPFTGLTLSGGFITIQGITRAIISNTTNTITVADAWSSTQSGQQGLISYWVDDWFRARVLEVSRKPRAKGGAVVYEDSKIVFVIDDVNWNYLG